MTLPYSEPGVQIRELESPNFGAISSSAPTTVALVGPSRGFETNADVIRLVDNEKVTLSKTYADLASIKVYDASDPNAAAFVESNVSNGNRDYTLDLSEVSSGIVKISRSMQTSIDDGETVVTYFENSGSPSTANSITRQVSLDRTYSKLADGSLGASGVNGLASGTVTNTLAVQSQGQVPVSEVTVTGSGTQTATLTWQNVGSGQVIRKFQTIYADYKLGGVQYIDQPIQLNNASAVTLSNNQGLVTEVVLKNATGLGNTNLATAAIYAAAASSTDNDYLVSGSGLTLAIGRTIGSTSMNTTDDEIRVRVEYQSTSADYWAPTRITAPSDAERKYGAALDSNGNINSPLSFAAGLSFANGATELVLQALFTDSTPRTQPTGSSSDWSASLASLRTQENVNVIVPILGVGGSVQTSNDTLVATIASAVKTHLQYMAGYNKDINAVIGTDGTTSGQGGRQARRALAQLLADQKFTVLSPSSLTFVNQLNREIAVGGQYAAAAFAGALCRYPIQTTLTRKYLVGFRGVNETMEPADLNTDASAGLTVLRNNNGVQIRHSITTAVNSIATRELSVVRAKFYMMTLIRKSIDDQIVGQIIADENAPFTVQVMIGGILETLVTKGIIVTYNGLQATLSESNPTQVEVRYAYKPAFPLNYVSVEFNIDLSTGTITPNTTAQAA